MQCYLGLGSNLGNRWKQLGDAVDALRGLDDDLSVSSVYETNPVGGPDGQGPYLNAVVRLTTTLSARELLVYCQDLEHNAGRVRVERWGSRTLDVDVLIIDGLELDEDDLVVPHPRMFERAFVVVPLFEIAPELLAPTWLADLGGADVVDADVRRVGALVAGSWHERS